MASLSSRNLKSNKIAWIIQYYDNGKKKTKYLGVMTKTRAKALFNKFENEMSEMKFDSNFDRPKTITIKELSTLYIKTKYSDPNGPSARRMNDTIKKFIAHSGNITLQEIDLNLLGDWKNDRLTEVTKSTFNVDIRNLRSLFNFAIEQNYAKNSPFKSFKQIPIHQKFKGVIPYDDTKKFFASITNKMDLCYFMILYSTGCRAGEAANLKWKDVDLEKGTALLTETKSKKDRKVGLTNELKILLIEMKRDNTDNHDRLFFNLNETDKSRPAKIMKKYLKLAGLPLEYSPHWFRHSFATHALENKVSISLVQEIMGHSDIAVTARYLHPEFDKYKEISEAFPSPLN